MTTNLRPVFSITNSITNGLTHIERARGFLEAATLSEHWVREMGRRALILEAHHTTHIEGTRLTLEQSERLLKGNSVPEADPDDVDLPPGTSPLSKLDLGPFEVHSMV